MVEGGNEGEEHAKRAAARDGTAFDALVAPHLGALWIVARRRTRSLPASDVDPDDLVQIALGRAWELLPELEWRGDRPFLAWLVALVDAAAADRLRYLAAKGRGAVRHRESFAGENEPFRGAKTSSLWRSAARREERDRLVKALDVLTPEQREVVERHVFEAQSLGETAAALGIAKNAVWERLRRGLARLRGALEA